MCPAQIDTGATPHKQYKSTARRPHCPHILLHFAARRNTMLCAAACKAYTRIACVPSSMRNSCGLHGESRDGLRERCRRLEHEC